MSCGNLREGVSYLEASTRGNDRMNRIVPLLGVLYGSAFPGWLAVPFHLLGRIDEAVKLSDEGLRHARESRHIFSLGMALLIKGTLARFRREPESARTYYEEAVTLSEENGFPSWLAAAGPWPNWGGLSKESQKWRLQQKIATGSESQCATIAPSSLRRPTPEWVGPKKPLEC